MIKKLVHNLVAQRQADRQAELYRNLIRREAKVGGHIFGPVAPGTRREFFCLDEHTWVWHEEWIDSSGVRRNKTTRYDVRPSGILKVQNGQYQQISQQESEHLREAVKTYQQKIRTHIYGFVN